VKGVNARARLQKIPEQFHRRAAAECVSVGGVSQAEHGDFLSAQIAETRLQSPQRPTTMQIVALRDGRNDRNFFVFRSRQFGQHNNITRERAAGKRTTGTEISLWPDAWFAFQTGGNLLGVRADVFAQSCNLVDERDGKREK